MKAKNIVSVVLLVFVAASIVYLVVSETRSQPGTEQAGQKATVAQAHPTNAAAKPAPGGDESEDPVHKVTAYYFHGDFRCRTCLTMERYAREALEEGLAEELESGWLEWRAVNYDKPENEHFTRDYGLTSSAVVLVNRVDNKQKEWKNLQQIWDWVGDEQGFKDYVRNEALTYLEDGS